MRSLMRSGPGTRTGQANGLRWAVEEALSRTDQRRLLGLIRLKVRVNDVSGRQLFRGETFKLKPLPQL